MLFLLFAVTFSWYCPDNYRLCPEPDWNQDFNNYLQGLVDNANSIKWRTGFVGDQYEKIPWTQTNIVHAQVHTFDRYIYDRDSHKWTVDRYVQYAKDRYGGLDSVLLWPTYTQIGADDRNQFDLHRVVPGGMEQFKKVVKEFQSYGIKVLLPLNPWDSNTRDERVGDDVALIDLIIESGADGFNGDTLYTIPKSYWDYAVSRGAYLAMEPEAYGTLGDVDFITLGWGYYMKPENECPDDEIGNPPCYYPKPGVDHMKMVDGRRMTHVTDRWLTKKVTMIQLAYFNANGVNVWENVWGTYNNVTDYDAELIRRSAHVLRYFSASGHTVIGLPDWQPHYPTTASASDCIYTAMFRVNSTKWGQESQLVLFVNYCDKEVRDVSFDVHYWKVNYAWDCWTGEQLKSTQISMTMESRGFGCVYATEKMPDRSTNFEDYLQERMSLTKRPISEFSDEFVGLQQTLMAKETRITNNTDGMVLIPKTNYHFKAQGVEREGVEKWVDFQFPWEPRADRYHEKTLNLGPFYIDKHPVTNSDYFLYLQATGYKPADDINFLKHWMEWEYSDSKNCWPNGDSTTDSSSGAVYDRCCPQNDYFWVGDIQECQRICMTTEGCNCVTYYNYQCFLRKDCQFQNCANSGGWTSAKSTPTLSRVPEDYRNSPVVYLSYAEAQDYCKWRGKRLPHSYEWQLAAQGTDGRNFPWGWNDDGNRRPPTTNARHLAAPVDIGSYSNGASPYGVEDMVKYVWEYTDMFRDEHTDAVLVKGGSNYNPDQSYWYFPQPDNLMQHNKYFLMDDAYERAGTVGFRCASDLQETPAAPYHYEEVFTTGDIE